VHHIESAGVQRAKTQAIINTLKDHVLDLYMRDLLGQKMYD
jgi:hypothetical protein